MECFRDDELCPGAVFPEGNIIFFFLPGCARPVIAQEWEFITPLVADAPAEVELFPFTVRPAMRSHRRWAWPRPSGTYCRTVTG